MRRTTSSRPAGVSRFDRSPMVQSPSTLPYPLPSPPDQPPLSRPACLLHLGARLFQLRLKPRPVNVHLGMEISHGPQLVEHGGDIPRPADLIGFGVIGP